MDRLDAKEPFIEEGDLVRIELRWSEVFLAIVALASLAAVYQQHRLAKHLRAELSSAIGDREALAARTLRDESDLSLYRGVLRRSQLSSSVSIEGEDLDSKRIRVRLGSSNAPIILYSIDPDCPACLATLPFINELAIEGPCNVRVLGIGVNGWSRLDSLSRSHELRFPILRSSGGEAWELFPIAASPSTVLIMPNGRLHGWWLGAIEREERVSIKKMLSTSCASQGR